MHSMNDGVVVVQAAGVLVADDDGTPSTCNNNKHDDDNDDCMNNDELDSVLSIIVNVISIDLPLFSSMIERIERKKDDVICKAVDELLSKINSCLFRVDTFRGSLIPDDDEEKFLTKVDTLLTNCQTGYSTVLTSLLEHPHCLQHFTVQTVILDCLVEQAFISLTWKKTRQVILDCIPYIYSCCCIHHNNYNGNNNNNNNNNTSILFEAFKEVLNRNYKDSLVPILSCLFSNDLFLEEAMSIAQHAFSSFLEDDHNLDPNDFSFLIKTLLIHSQTEQEVSEIALQIHNKCTAIVSSSEIDIVIGLLVSDLIIQLYPNKDCYSSQSKLIIQQGFTGHITTLLQQTMAVHLAIPDFFVVLSLFYISSTTADTSWNHSNSNIQNLLRQCWITEMKYYSNHDNISNSSIVYVLGKVIQRMISYVDIDNKNGMVQLLLQICAELVVWMLIMTTSTAKTERQRKIIQDHFFNILHQLLGVSDDLQSWILETFLSLSSPMIQMELNACYTKKQNELKQQPQQVCVLSLDFFIFQIQQQRLQEQQHTKSRFLQYLTSKHPNIANTFMVRFVEMADLNNNNNLTLHKLSFVLSYFIINIDNNNISNFLLFLQKLFFNHNFTSAYNKICKQCIGILLSTHLIHRVLSTTNEAYYDDVSSIFDWTCQVLHSSLAVIDENSNMIGTYGCYFLSVCGLQANDIDQNEQQSKRLPTTLDCNNHCKDLLAATGLIQSEQSLSRNNKYVLGFGDAQLPEAASVRRPLVLCATDIFFSRGGSSFSGPNTIKGNTALVTFVFRLIHTYLTLGRKCSTSWAPLSWLTMKLQLPAWPLVDESNGTMESFWQVWCLTLDENDSESRYDNLDDDMVQPLLQVAWIGCIAISAILAILHHARDSPNNNRTLLTHLIRFQLARIYSIEIVVQKCYRLLISIRTGKRRKNSADSDFVATQANEIQKCLSIQKLSYLDIPLLCTSLCYSSNTDDVLNKLMKSDVQPGTKKSSESALLHEVYLRTCLLESFAKAVRQGEPNSSLDPTDYYGDDPATFLPFRIDCIRNDTPDILLHMKDNMTCIVKIVEATQFLISWLCRLRRLQLTAYGTDRTLKEKKDHITLELATRLASAHYEVIRAMLLRGRTGNQSADQASFTFTPLFVNFVRSSAVQLQSDLSSSDSLAPCLEHMFHFFSKQLKQCEDGSIATQLIDILSLLTYGVNKAHVTKDLIWKAIHTIYPSNLDVLSLTDSRRLWMERRVLSSPFDLFQQKISQFISTTLKQISNDSAAGATFSMLEKVFTCTNKKSFRHCYVLRHMLISLWVLSPAEETYSFLRKLFLALKSFVQKTISDELHHFTTTSKKRRPKVSSRASDDEVIPGLTRISISPFFEILITTVAASLVMCLPSAEKSIATPSSTARTPYRGIQNLVLLLIDMIDFFQQSCKVFSKDSVALLLRICMILIKSMEWQLSACIDWRNSRPLLTEDEEEAGFVDLASVSLLQPLIDSYASCAGAIAALCDKIRFQATNKGRMKNLKTTLDADIGGESWIYASFQNSVATLLLRCEKFVVALRETSSAHNLRPPRFKEGVVYREHVHVTEKNVSSMTASEQNWSDIDGLREEEFSVKDNIDDDDMSSVDFSNDSESFTAVGWGGGDVDNDSE